MGSSELSRIKERSESRKTINKIYENSSRAYLIHYSCESFYDGSGESKRATSIAIRNLKSAQTKSWSIFKTAELKHIEKIQENLDKLEKEMLKEYFSFLEKNKDMTFIHWNMRDENYGFAALEHRFRVLGGKPYELHDDQKFDLARTLVTLYGRSYAPHTSQNGRKGRIMSIVEINKIADMDALTGEQEAEAFRNEEYLKLHQSTLRKVDIFANIFDRTHAKTLKTEASFLDSYGVHPIALIEIVKNSPYVSALIFIASIAGAALKFTDLWTFMTT